MDPNYIDLYDIHKDSSESQRNKQLEAYSTASDSSNIIDSDLGIFNSSNNFEINSRGSLSRQDEKQQYLNETIDGLKFNPFIKKKAQSEKKQQQKASSSSLQTSPMKQLNFSENQELQDILKDCFKKHKKNNKSVAVTYSDRYIPLRSNQDKQILLTCAHNDQQQEENRERLDQDPRMPNNNSNNYQQQQQYNDREHHSIPVSDLYRLYVLNQNPNTPQCKSKKEIYHNENYLRFSKQQTGYQQFIDERVLKETCILENNKEQIFKTNKGKKIHKIPYKVLDAPALQDDFYLNLIDWSNQNILAVGLSSCVYLWNAENSQVTKLCEIGLNDSVTSVAWNQKDSLLSVGTNSGEVQIWDTEKLKKVRTMQGHLARVGTLAWNSTLLSSGSRDKSIMQRDLRVPQPYISKYLSHKQEVCGLKWSFDEQFLASGGNDNKLYIWNAHSNQPVSKFSQHQAAVKALAWSPHQHGLLVSGGGTADRTIRFWNVLEQKQLDCVDTGSQVCNLIFSKNDNQLVSTHGYSLNQIIVWDYPEMEKITTLTGHTYRVLYLAMSPNGETIVTGAGDETLRFWNVFEKNHIFQPNLNSLILPENNCLR